MTERQGPNPRSPRTAEGAGSQRRDTPRREGRPTPEQRDPEAARRQAEERATAEILALEDDLDRERERAGRSIEEIQRRLEEAEARAAGDVTVTDARAREDAANRLQEQRGDVPREAESERRMPARERELIAERDETAEALENGLKRLGEHTQQLKAQIEALEAETDARVQKVVEEAEEQVRARLSAEQKKLARAAELRFQSALKSCEQSLRSEREAATEAAEAAQRRLDEIAEQIEAAGQRVEGAESQLADEKATHQDETEKRLEAELKRLEAEADSRFDHRLAKVVTETETRMQEDAERRLREQEEILRAEAEERVRATTETVRDETARQTREELERLRAELEEERDSRGKLIEEAEQRALKRDAERSAEAQVAAARRGTAQAKKDADDAETDEQAAVERPKGRRGFSLGRLRPRRRRKAVEEADDAAVATEDEAERKPAGADDAGAEKAGKTGETKKESRAKAAQQRKAKAGVAKTTSRGKSAAETAESKPKRSSDSPLDVNEATFEQLRDLGMSVTQATRVIAYREREAGFDSVDDLDSVPGIPKPFGSELKDRLTA
jgi:DNA uptake protein ComE-like DNA-binding protein